MSIALGVLHADAYSGLLCGPFAIVASNRISSVLGIPPSVITIGGVLMSTYSGLLAYLLRKEKLSKRTLWLSIGFNTFAAICGEIGLWQIQNLTFYGKGILGMLVIGSGGVIGTSIATLRTK